MFKAELINENSKQQIMSREFPKKGNSLEIIIKRLEMYIIQEELNQVVPIRINVKEFN